MSFSDWINSSYPNPSIDGQWGLLHILTLVFCVALIVTFALVFRKRSLKTRKIVLWILVALILLFEITRRIVNLVKLNGGGIGKIISTHFCLVLGVLLLVGQQLSLRFSTKNFSITSHQ